MKKIIIGLMAVICAITTATAQKKEVNYQKIYYKDTKAENNEVIITIGDAVSTGGETKMKLKITNKTDNFIIYKPEESTFVVNGKESKAQEKWLVIAPHESDFKILNLKGEGYNKVKNYSFVAGGLYKVLLGKATEAPEYRLPASQNDFTAGNYSVSLKKLKKETDRTDVKFSCVYNGDKLGFIFPSKAAVRMPDGKEYAGKVSSGLFAKSGPVILKKGQEDSFSISWDRMPGGKETDMQKVDMFIKWNDTFVEGTPENLKSETLQLEFDEATSNAKGK